MEKTKAARKSVALLLMGVLALTALAGCSGGDQVSEEEAQEAQIILEKLDAIQAQIDGMGEDLATLTGHDEPEVVMAGLKTVQQFARQFDDLKERVSAAAVVADSTSVPENKDERPAAYFEAIAPLQELSDELDLLAETYVRAFTEGTLSGRDVWTLEARKGEIADMISLTEDSLAFRMGSEG